MSIIEDNLKKKKKLMKEKSELLQTATFSQNMSYCSYLLIHVCVSWNKTKLKIS